MSVELESAKRLNALKAKADAKTGETSDTLADAVDTLIAGFGQGGGDGDNTILDELIGGTLTELTWYGVNVASHAFYSNPSLLNITLPNAVTFGTDPFRSCVVLETATLSSIGQNCPSFRGCAKLRAVDLTFKGKYGIPNSTFYDCRVLDTVILRCDQMVSLIHSNGFGHTPFEAGGTGGTVYVPAALIESYKTAANWVTLYDAGTCNFVAIEGSEYE